MNGYAKIITAVLLFSLGPLLVRLIDLDAISILFCASLIAFIFLLLKLFVQKRTKEIFKLNKGVLLLIGLGIFTTINNSLFNTAIKTTTISNATLTHYLAPVFLVIFAAIFIKEKIRKISIIAMIISFLGLLIILSPNEITFSNAHFLGLLLGTLSALFFALESLLKKFLSKD